MEFNIMLGTGVCAAAASICTRHTTQAYKDSNLEIGRRETNYYYILLRGDLVWKHTHAPNAPGRHQTINWSAHSVINETGCCIFLELHHK
jgi:hypothetical protein